jgi:hypothetical protein
MEHDTDQKMIFIKIYSNAVKNCFFVYFFLYLWWLIITIINFFTGKIRFSFSNLIPFNFHEFMSLISFSFIKYGIIIAVLETVFSLTLMKLVRTEKGYTRQHPFACWCLQTCLAALNAVIPVWAFYRITSQLHKTYIAVLIITLILSVLQIHSIHQTKSATKQIKTEVMCAYLYASEWNYSFNLVNVINNGIFSDLSFAAPLIKFVEYIYKMDHGIICPYWIYMNYFNNGSSNRSPKIIFYADASIIGELKEWHKKEIYAIIDDCISRQSEVLVVYRQYNIKAEDQKFYVHGNTQYDPFIEELIKRPVRFVSIGSDMKEDTLKEFLLQDEAIAPYADRIAKIHGYLGKYPNNEKYIYLKEEITKLHNNMDEVEAFYRLVKMAEYIFHYRGLALLAKSPETEFLQGRSSFEGSMGTWKDVQNRTKKVYREDAVIEAYRLIYRIMNQKETGKKTVTYIDICDLLTQLRNRYVGHGTMAFSVSAELLSALTDLVLIILDEFLNDGLNITEEDRIRIDENTELPCCRLITDYVGLLSGFSLEGPVAEYIDYCRGTIISNETVTYELSYHTEKEA